MESSHSSHPAEFGALKTKNQHSSNKQQSSNTNTQANAASNSNTMNLLNTISHPGEYSRHVGANSTTPKVSKPQFSAKNQIEPISGPKAPPKIQCSDENNGSGGFSQGQVIAIGGPGQGPPNRARASNRLRSLDPGGIGASSSTGVPHSKHTHHHQVVTATSSNLILSPRVPGPISQAPLPLPGSHQAKTLNLPSSNNITNPTMTTNTSHHNSNPAQQQHPNSSQHNHRHHHHQTLSLQKTPKLTASMNPTERRSLDVQQTPHSSHHHHQHQTTGIKGGLAKDYYSAVGGGGGTQAKSGSGGGLLSQTPTTSYHHFKKSQSSSGAGAQAAFNSSRSTVAAASIRRQHNQVQQQQQMNNVISSSNSGAISAEDVPYPPNTSHQQQLMHQNPPVPSSKKTKKASLSLSRNASQMRTAGAIVGSAMAASGATTTTNSQTLQHRKPQQQQTEAKPATIATGNQVSTSTLLPTRTGATKSIANETASHHYQKNNHNHHQYGGSTKQSHYQQDSAPRQTHSPPNGSGESRSALIRRHQNSQPNTTENSLPNHHLQGTAQRHHQHLQHGSRLHGERRSQDLLLQLNQQSSSTHNAPGASNSMTPDDSGRIYPPPSSSTKFTSVASRIAHISNPPGIKPGTSQSSSSAAQAVKTATGKTDIHQRVSSQDAANPTKKSSAMISAYAKTSSGLRTASFRQSNFDHRIIGQHGSEASGTGEGQAPPHHLPRDKLQHHNHQYQNYSLAKQLLASPKNNNYLQQTNSSGAGQTVTGRSSKTNSHQIKNHLPQGSNKLIKSAQSNPFANAGSVADSLTQQSPQPTIAPQSESLMAEGAPPVTTSSLSNQQKNYSSSKGTKAVLAASSNTSIKVRSIQSRISQAKINNSLTAPSANAADSNAKGSTTAGSAGNNLGRCQSMSDRLSGALLTNSDNTQGTRSNEESTKVVPQPDSGGTVPSTGGSDEAIQPVSSAEQSSSIQQNQNTTNGSQMINVNFAGPCSPTPVQNPLKDFEPAKFASKTHGLITSYAANTHQGIQRNYNEDRVSIILNMTKPATRKDVSSWPKCSYFAIYDGHGGSACSDFLKDQLHLIIINQESFPRDPAQALTTGCLEAERRFIENADRQTPMHERSGSCGIVVLIVGKECYVANVGDSRAIMSADKGKKLFLLSRDHRPNEDYEVQRIVKNGGGIYQTQSIQNVQVPGGEEGKMQQQYILGPHRVIPGRLSVSRTFGDIEAKHPKYGGKEGVIIAQPEISQFSVRNDFHDFVVLGCDGIFDRLSNQQVLDACWDTINSIKSNEVKQGSLTPKTVHQVSGAMADAIIKQAAIERSMDNLTIVIVTFDNLESFLNDRPKPTRLENHLFQIKEVESAATSTVVQPTPALTESQLTGSGCFDNKKITGSSNLSSTMPLSPPVDGNDHPENQQQLRPHKKSSSNTNSVIKKQPASTDREKESSHKPESTDSSNKAVVQRASERTRTTPNKKSKLVTVLSNPPAATANATSTQNQNSTTKTRTHHKLPTPPPSQSYTTNNANTGNPSSSAGVLAASSGSSAGAAGTNKKGNSISHHQHHHSRTGAKTLRVVNNDQNQSATGAVSSSSTALRNRSSKHHQIVQQSSITGGHGVSGSKQQQTPNATSHGIGGLTRNRNNQAGVGAGGGDLLAPGQTPGQGGGLSLTMTSVPSAARQTNQDAVGHQLSLNSMIRRRGIDQMLPKLPQTLTEGGIVPASSTQAATSTVAAAATNFNPNSQNTAIANAIASNKTKSQTTSQQASSLDHQQISQSPHQQPLRQAQIANYRIKHQQQKYQQQHNQQHNEGEVVEDNNSPIPEMKGQGPR